jgi:hypothetical protein
MEKDYKSLSAQHYAQGGVFQWSGFSSTSDTVMDRSRFLGTDGPRTLFQLEPDAGRRSLRGRLLAVPDGVGGAAAAQRAVFELVCSRSRASSARGTG